MINDSIEYFIHHQLRAGLARIEGLVYLLHLESKKEEGPLPNIDRSYTLKLINNEVKKLKEFTEDYSKKKDV